MRDLQNPLKRAELVARTAKKENSRPKSDIIEAYKSNFINDMSNLRDTLSQTWLTIQSSLFP
jgi:hypothetical protein